MSISKRQFNLLQAMGITVWQRRELLALNDSNETKTTSQTATPLTGQANSSENQTKNSDASAVSIAALDLSVLLKAQLFNDVLTCLGASSADLAIEHNQINLGIINWQFTADNTIEFEHNCLKSPDLTTLANSPVLKKALWQSIGSLSAT